MFIETGSCKNEIPLELLEQPACMFNTQWDARQRTVLIKDTMIRLTPIQYRILIPLKAGKPVTYAQLARLVYDCPLDENVKKTMDKQIDRLRAKLHGTGVYIYCVLKYGYMLICESPAED